MVGASLKSMNTAVQLRLRHDFGLMRKYQYTSSRGLPS
jgi:hypothetical protein